jgi:hypothetical protein
MKRTSQYLKTKYRVLKVKIICGVRSPWYRVFASFISHSVVKKFQLYSIAHHCTRYELIHSMNSSTLWDITLCTLVKVNWCIRGIYYLHHHSWGVSEEETSVKHASKNSVHFPASQPISLISTLVLPSYLKVVLPVIFFLCFQAQIPYELLIASMYATCSAHFVILY